VRRLVPALLVTTIAFAGGCDDNKAAPRTAHATRGARGARRKAQAATPAKRFGEFDLHVDREPFLAAGCLEGRDEATLDCHAAPFVATFGCEPDVTVEELLGGLKRGLAAVVCRVPGDAGGITQVGCRRPAARKLVVWDANTFVLVQNEEALRKRFGPAKSADAALGFAVAHARDARARFDQVTFDDPAPVEEDVMPSNVLPRKDGWVVRLFERQLCGCTHPDYALDLFVTKDGEVSQLAKKQIHVDPATEGRCVE
jgi:hypothetical protein